MPKPTKKQASAPRLRAYGDNAVLVDWQVDGFDAGVSDAVHALAAKLQGGPFIEVMPGYDSLVAAFDASLLPLDKAISKVEKALASAQSGQAAKGKVVDIPVRYGGDYGPDLDALAAHAKLSPEEVVERHSQRDYRVCMMGFIPGFAFLSEVDKKLHHPRHATPRALVPAGSVGIANWQTGIYGLDSPGGWQIIGRTDLQMFDANRDAPFLVEAGDMIRFVPL